MIYQLQGRTYEQGSWSNWTTIREFVDLEVTKLPTGSAGIADYRVMADKRLVAILKKGVWKVYS